MGRIEKKKKLIIERANRKMLGEAEMDCPKAAKDLELNTKNRNSAIKADHIKYGPLNVDEPGDYRGDVWFQRHQKPDHDDSRTLVFLYWHRSAWRCGTVHIWPV